MIPERKVGFWFSEKKKKKLSCQQLAIALKFVFDNSYYYLLINI